MRKTIVIGIDGGSWNYIQNWIDQGKLPTFKSLQQKGKWGILQSQLPPVTSPNWKCYSTGLNPAKLGVFWWENVDVKNRKIYIPSSKSFSGKEIFDYLSDAGKRVGVLNMPTLYPPHKINGLMVAGGPDAMESDFTYPEPLEKMLKNKFDYRVLPQNISFMKKDADQVIEEIYRLIETRFKAAEFLLTEGDFDFFQVTTYLINVLQHYHWGDDKVFKAWQIIDRGVSILLEKFPDRLFLFMSDHGTNEIKIKFNISTWLEQKGYLKLVNTTPLISKVGKYLIKKEDAVKILTKLHLKETIKKIIPSSIRDRVPGSDGTIQRQGKEDLILWDKSQCIASGQGPIYLLNKDEAFKNKLIRELEQLEHNGIKIVNKVYTKEEIYSGEHFEAAPDLIVDQAPNTHFSGSVGAKEAFEAPQHWKGENEKQGLFLAYYDGIRPEKLNPNILDLAPTILNQFDVEVPKEMDGEIISL